MTISQTTQSLLKAAAGRGVSNDPELMTRSKVRLLQNTSKKPKHGLGAPGLFVLPDEAATCVTSLRVVPAALYPIFVERTPDDKYAGEHFVLPPGAEKDGYRWRLPDGNTLEKEARLAGLFSGPEAEFDLAKTAMKTARAFNADAKAHAKKHELPLFGLVYALDSQEVVNDRGQTFFGPVFDFVGEAGSPEGPAEEEIIRANALLDIVEATLAEAKRGAALMAGDRQRIEITSPNPRPLITSGRQSWARPESPPAPIDDDIPF
jgi:hypothetical protein